MNQVNHSREPLIPALVDNLDPALRNTLLYKQIFPAPSGAFPYGYLYHQLCFSFSLQSCQ